MYFSDKVVDLRLGLLPLDHLDDASGEVDLLHRVVARGDRETDARIPTHVALFHPALRGVERDPAVFHVRPDRGDLRRSVRIHGCHEEDVGVLEKFARLVAQLGHVSSLRVYGPMLAATQ